MIESYLIFPPYGVGKSNGLVITEFDYYKIILHVLGPLLIRKNESSTSLNNNKNNK